MNATKTITRYGMELTATVAVGSHVLVDGWNTKCTSKIETAWDDVATFAIPSGRYAGVKFPCEIEITGRTAQRLPYSDCNWVKVKITWVHIDEPNTVSTGWVAV